MFGACVPLAPCEEWWRIYGDARTYDKQKSFLVAIGISNDEQLLNGMKIQSPNELWPISIFYFANCRINLELNLSGKSYPTKSTGWLNQWIENMQPSHHKVYLTGDSMFLDAVADKTLDPKATTIFAFIIMKQCRQKEKFSRKLD